MPLSNTCGTTLDVLQCDDGARTSAVESPFVRSSNPVHSTAWGRGIIMRRSCRVTISDRVFFASRGDILLDAALTSGVDIPHDCRSGHCGTCRVRVLNGLAVGGECKEPGAARACQSRIMSDLQIEIEGVSQIQTVAS